MYIYIKISFASDEITFASKKHLDVYVTSLKHPGLVSYGVHSCPQDVQVGQGTVHEKPRGASGIRDHLEPCEGQARQDGGQDGQGPLRAHSQESPGFIV